MQVEMVCEQYITNQCVSCKVFFVPEKETDQKCKRCIRRFVQKMFDWDENKNLKNITADS